MMAQNVLSWKQWMTTGPYTELVERDTTEYTTENRKANGGISKPIRHADF